MVLGAEAVNELSCLRINYQNVIQFIAIWQINKKNPMKMCHLWRNREWQQFICLLAISIARGNISIGICLDTRSLKNIEKISSFKYTKITSWLLCRQAIILLISTWEEHLPAHLIQLSITRKRKGKY